MVKKKSNQGMKGKGNHRYLFVYGTLKKGFRLNQYLKGALFIRNDSISGFDIYSNGSYPMIVRGQGMVLGEVYRVPLKMFRDLDMIEGAYDRTEVETDKGYKVDAYIFKYDTKGHQKLKSEFELKHQGGFW